MLFRSCATLTFNAIGRHQSRLVNTRIASNLSPWFSACELGDIHSIAISHGEGRFVAPRPLLERLKDTGQIATQYVDASGQPSLDLSVNPNGSMLAIEGITSPDGRILGKMGHSERSTKGTFKNVCGRHFQPYFSGALGSLMSEAAQAMATQLALQMQQQMAAATGQLGTQLSSAISGQLQKQMATLTSAMQDGFSVDPTAFANAIRLNVSQDDLTSLLTNFMNAKDLS